VSAALGYRRFFIATAIATFAAATFVAFVRFEVPGLGIAHFFYIPIVLIALAAGPLIGGCAGILAAALYAAGVAWVPHTAPGEGVFTVAAVIRLATYTTIGVLIGWFARRNGELVDRLRLLADTDILTGMPNARAYEAALAERLRAGRPFALLLGDMDSLKGLNDLHGHAAGNDALHQVASCLREALRPVDDLARIGGDEFAALAELDGRAEVLSLRSRLELVATQARVPVTFGYALYPGEGTDAVMLFRVADERLYDRKRRAHRERMLAANAVHTVRRAV
jgi:diguanylate cyclase (GGDEF)-like protein